MPNRSEMANESEKSTVLKRSVVIDGHKTSVSLEAPFWEVLREIAYTRRTTLSALVTNINAQRDHDNLSSALRLFVLGECRQRAMQAVPIASSIVPDQSC